MINTEEYLNKGYHFGEITDIIDDVEEFNKMCDGVMSIPFPHEDYWQCQYLVSENEQYPEQLIPHTIPLSKEPERTRFVKENNLYVISLNYVMKSVPEEIQNYFKIKTSTFIEKIYGCNVEENSHRSFACYFDGGKLDPHTDAQTNELCALVLYLSNDIWNNNGGLLKITENNDSCIPIRGNYSIMDLTKHNKRHEVTQITGDFRRYSYLVFPRTNDK